MTHLKETDRHEAEHRLEDEAPLAGPSTNSEDRRREALRKIGKFSAYAAPAIVLLASGKAAANSQPT